MSRRLQGLREGWFHAVPMAMALRPAGGARLPPDQVLGTPREGLGQAGTSLRHSTPSCFQAPQHGLEVCPSIQRSQPKHWGPTKIIWSPPPVPSDKPGGGRPTKDRSPEVKHIQGSS